MVEKFWQVEEYPVDLTSAADESCEGHFVHNTLRNSDGRFVVRLHRRAGDVYLGDSLAHAKQRFQTLERKLMKKLLSLIHI